MKILVLTLFSSLYVYFCNAQDNLVTETKYLSKECVVRLANNKFGSLVTGQSNSTNLLNYASFNPVAGSFNFNGSLPIGKDNNNSRFSFLSVKISGDLISDSYAALFQNMKLNTNISVSGQWDIQFKKGFHYTYLVSEEFNFNQKRSAVEFQWSENDAKLINQTATLGSQINLVASQIVVLDINLRRYRDTFERMESDLIYLRLLSPDSADQIQTKYDSVVKKKAQIDQFEKDRSLARLQKDSLIHISSDDIGFTIASQRKIDEERFNKIRLLEDSAAITSIKFSWVSLFASTGRKNYYSFNPLEVFANQIQKLESNPWRVGVMYNHYSERSFPKRILLWNIGIFRYEDNNLALLSTQDVVQEKVITNTLEDTTRKISKTYKAYTDEVVTSKVWNFVSNIYFLYSSRKSGFHLYPSVDLYDKGKTLANLGLGYLASFKNTEKDKPIINAEVYIQLQDIGNALERENNFLKRSEIGIRFALPFTFFN